MTPAPAKASAPADGGMLTMGEPNFRFHAGAVQIVVPLALNLFGLQQEITVVAKGAFVKKRDAFTFEPQTLYLGSCPVQRLPVLREYVANKVRASRPVPEDVAAAWPKLAAVTVEGNVLKLTMP
jgi:hypothetical protein